MRDNPVPRPSATVILARAATAAPEIFMVRRHQSAAFGNAYAFPGGVVDADDNQVAAFSRGLSMADANHRLGVAADGLSYYSAAIRELFEESGVLLGDFSRLDENLQSVRDSLNTGNASWADIVCRNELPLYCDALAYVSHWITPPDREKRYSTRFFLTRMPDRQDAIHCGSELIDSRWTTATDMLRQGRNGNVTLHYPTEKTLESIARHDSLEALLDWAQSCVDWGITTMLPIAIERDGRTVLALPGEMDYPGTKS